MNIERELESLLSPAVIVSPIPNCPKSSSDGQFGGRPSFGWPTCTSCGALEYFILELNFAKFSQVSYNRNLSLFYCWNCMPFSSDQPGITLWEQGQSNNINFIDQNSTFDPDYEIIPSGMKFEEIQVIPPPETLFKEHRELYEAFKVENPDDPWALYENFLRQYSIDRFYQTCISKYPRWIEGCVELTCACGKPMSPFFQIGSHSEINLMWEADGIMYLFTCTESDCAESPKMVIQGF